MNAVSQSIDGLFRSVCLQLHCTLNKAKFIENNKDTIKRCPVTSLMYFYVI